MLDPCTGYHADSGLVSLTVIADDGLMADALSTAIFASGIDKGMGT
ncbi:MAG TPA: FAD:protein FMN transferase [Bacillota bacterium]|nr:FAD:protein FMN transferase [Bacillota bacterium]